MADHRLRLTLLPGTFAVCRLDPNEAVPSWATGGRARRPIRRGTQLKFGETRSVKTAGVNRHDCGVGPGEVQGWQVGGTYRFGISGPPRSWYNSSNNPRPAEKRS